ncbi:hypothetical protein os4_28200 [Comamonadaceae bacterium OS-4]|nr:hypothetical protein os4_28200 [Comamonadaceae bacterium OS-4]
MKVAFSVFGGTGWTGGINYLRNLLSAVSELPGNPIEPVLFIAPETSHESVAMLTPYLAQPPVVVKGWSASKWSRLQRLAGSALLQRDFVSEAAFRREGIDVVFQHAAWYGMLFGLPTLAWIADFQHKHLPHMFSKANNIKRDLGYWALSYSATQVMLSSQDALRDCEHFFPSTRDKTAVLPFCVQLPSHAQAITADELRSQYQLPDRYFYLPNQLWKHKNHLAVIEALRILKQRYPNLVIVATGNPSDARNPAHPEAVLAKVQQYGLSSSFRFLGLVPYAHIMPLMRGAVAVVNPSLFEGWSTTVEEAKAMGVPLLLSNIGVHLEQATTDASFFDPSQPESIAECLGSFWDQYDPSHRTATEQLATEAYRLKRVEFAQNFVDIVSKTSQRATHPS